jgi:hypothetical protein
MVIAAAACPGCGIRIERSVSADSLPFRAICRSCRAHVTLCDPRGPHGAGKDVRSCLDCGAPLAAIAGSRNGRGPMPGLRLWVCRSCRIHHRQDEPGEDISRFLYLWNRRHGPNGQGES